MKTNTSIRLTAVVAATGAAMLAAVVLTAGMAQAMQDGKQGASQGQQGARVIRQGDRTNAPPPIRPPQLVIKNTRRSSKWIELPTGLRVAVDEGIAGEGVKVYMALTWHLVAVDESNEAKVLWHKNTSAFWDRVSIEQIEVEGQEEKTWTVALRSSNHEEFAEFHDLNTGEFIRLDGEEPAGGTAVELRQTWSGSGANRDEPLHAVIATADEWKKTREDLFAGREADVPTADEIDFTKEALLVYFAGKVTNCRGFSNAGAFETDDEFIIRVHAMTYQSSGETPPEWPYGVMVVPRMTEKPYVIHTNRQGLIGGPDMWKESRRFDPLDE